MGNHSWKCSYCGTEGFGCRDEDEALEKIDAHADMMGCGRTAARGTAAPNMTVVGYDSNFTDIGTSIRVALPSGGYATMGKTPLAKCFSNDELRAECERRGLPRTWCVSLGRTEHALHVAQEARDLLARDRDEWKRRAEAAEAAQALILARREPRPLAVWANETGPGIAAMKPDNSVAHLDEDLLCDDA